MASEARPPPSDLVNSIFKHARARALQQTSPQAPANMPVRLIYHWRSSSQTGTESIPWKIHGTVFPKVIQEKARKDEPSTRRSMDIHGHQGKCGYSGSHGTHGAARQKLLPRRHPGHDYGCMQGLAQPAEKFQSRPCTAPSADSNAKCLPIILPTCSKVPPAKTNTQQKNKQGSHVPDVIASCG